MTTRRRRLPTPAYVLLGAVGTLLVFGLIMVYSASSVADYVQLGDSAYHMRRQAIYALAGIVGLGVASMWDFRQRRGRRLVLTPSRVAWAVWTVAAVGLFAVQVAGVGKYGATRSIDLGIGFIQPSEFAKLGCLLVVAALAAAYRQGTLSPRVFAGRAGAAVGLVLVLVMLQPDLGTTLGITMMVFAMLWLAGIRLRWFALAGALGVPLAALLVRIALYRMERVTAFLDPWADPADSGYQIIQSLYAFGSGGLFGVGLGVSRQKFFYLPAAHNDFIFAIIGEETGLVGTLAVVLMFGLIGYAGTRIAVACKDPFGRLMAGGLTAMILIQALMNMAAVTRLMPITGIPLPFVSAGGSSLVLMLTSVGLIIAVARAGAADRIRAVGGTETKESHSARTLEWRRDGGSHLPRAGGGGAAGRRRA